MSDEAILWHGLDDPNVGECGKAKLEAASRKARTDTAEL